MHRKNLTPFTSALIVGVREAHTLVDRRFLHQAGVPQVRVAPTIRQALAALARNRPEVIVLDADVINVRWFMGAVDKMYPTDTPPVVLASLDGSENAVLEAIADGCTGFLLRPYSMNTFLTQIHRAKNGPDRVAAAIAERLSRRAERFAAHTCAPIPAPRTTTPAQQPGAARTLAKDKAEQDAQHEFAKGDHHLRSERYEEAVQAYTKALGHPALSACARLGLSRAWEGLGRVERAARARQGAAEEFLRRGDSEALRKMFAAEGKHPSASIFLDMGFSLVTRGDAKGAAKAFVQAASRQGNLDDVMPVVTRACHFTSAPEETAREVARALAEESGREHPSTYLHRIIGDLPRRARSAQPGAPVQAPKAMNDILAVLKHTYHVYKNGGFSADTPLPTETGRLALDF